MLVNKVSDIIKEYKNIQRSKRIRNNIGRVLKGSYIQGVELTKEEKMQIENKWKGTISIPISRGYNFFLGMKCLDGFDPNYLPSCYYLTSILKVLNDPQYCKLLNHKSLLELLYGNGIKHPKTILRSYGGMLLDEKYQLLQRNEAIEILKKKDCKLLYKPAAGAGQGKGIKLIADANDIDHICKELLNGEFIKNGDFVIQEHVTQSAETAIFNPTSLNSMRITTFNINDHVSPGSFALKCGPTGSVVDNVGSGKRGVIVGLDINGNLKDYGFYGNGEKAVAHNGVEFKGKVIPHFDRVVNAAVELHKHIEGCRIIGWDIALDNQYNPILIEGNMGKPGISFEQMCSGPIFGDRTDEVIDFIKANR